MLDKAISHKKDIYSMWKIREKPSTESTQLGCLMRILKRRKVLKP